MQLHADTHSPVRSVMVYGTKITISACLQNAMTLIFFVGNTTIVAQSHPMEG